MTSKGSKEKYASIIKGLAHELGFMFCGISKAEFLEEEAPRLEQWLNKNMHGEMAYMANHFEKRLDPTQLVPGAKSVISLAYNYAPVHDISENGSFKIAKYAYENNTTLKDAAQKLELLSTEDFDKFVRPEDMIGPLS